MHRGFVLFLFLWMSLVGCAQHDRPDLILTVEIQDEMIMAGQKFAYDQVVTNHSDRTLKLIDDTNGTWERPVFKPHEQYDEQGRPRFGHPAGSESSSSHWDGHYNHYDHYAITLKPGESHRFRRYHQIDESRKYIFQTTFTISEVLYQAHGFWTGELKSDGITITVQASAE